MDASSLDSAAIDLLRDFLTTWHHRRNSVARHSEFFEDQREVQQEEGEDQDDRDYASLLRLRDLLQVAGSQIESAWSTLTENLIPLIELGPANSGSSAASSEASSPGDGARQHPLLPLLPLEEEGFAAAVEIASCAAGADAAENQWLAGHRVLLKRIVEVCLAAEDPYLCGSCVELIGTLLSSTQPETLLRNLARTPVLVAFCNLLGMADDPRLLEPPTPTAPSLPRSQTSPLEEDEIPPDWPPSEDGDQNETGAQWSSSSEFRFFDSEPQSSGAWRTEQVEDSYQKPQQQQRVQQDQENVNQPIEPVNAGDGNVWDFSALAQGLDSNNATSSASPEVSGDGDWFSGGQGWSDIFAHSNAGNHPHPHQQQPPEHQQPQHPVEELRADFVPEFRLVQLVMHCVARKLLNLGFAQLILADQRLVVSMTSLLSKCVAWSWSAMVLDLMPQLVEALGTLVAVERALAEQGRLPSRVGGSDAPLGQIEAVVTGAVFEAVDLFTRRASRIDEMASLTFLEGILNLLQDFLSQPLPGLDYHSYHDSISELRRVLKVSCPSRKSLLEVEGLFIEVQRNLAVLAKLETAQLDLESAQLAALIRPEDHNDDHDQESELDEAALSETSEGFN